MLFSIKRVLVFHKMTCCFLCTFWCKETPERHAIYKPRFWNVKYLYPPSLARTHTRALQEFFSFCCHKCHTIIDKVLYFSLLWVFLLCILINGCFKRRKYAGKDNDVGRFFRFYCPQKWLFFHQLFLCMWHLWQQKNKIAVGRRAYTREGSKWINRVSMWEDWDTRR
mgnify:CR=1 FL=1